MPGVLCHRDGARLDVGAGVEVVECPGTEFLGFPPRPERLGDDPSLALGIVAERDTDSVRDAVAAFASVDGAGGHVLDSLQWSGSRTEWIVGYTIGASPP